MVENANFQITGLLFKNTDWVKLVLGPGHLLYFDHLGGFTQDYYNEPLSCLPPGTTVYLEYLLPDYVKDKYPTLDFVFDAETMIIGNHLTEIVTYPEMSGAPRTHFLCSFNGSYHLSRGLVVTELYRRKWFNASTCTKGFSMPNLDPTPGHINLFDYKNLDLQHNITVLSPIIQQCFVQLVSETVAESYVPFVTEKILFPCLNNTLWLAYAQPGYYQWVEKHLGFRRFSVFDYSFDSVQDPTQRLTVLLDMLAPFEHMSPVQWQEIYAQEADTIAYNFEHARNLGFVDTLRKFNERTNKIQASARLL